MTTESLPLALNRLQEAVEDVQREMETSTDFDDLMSLHDAVLPLTVTLMHVDDLATHKAETMIGRKA